MNGHHTQPAGTRRQPYGYADGGIVGGIRRLFTKTPATTPPPAAPPTAEAPAAAPAPAPNAIAGYAGMTAMQRREQAAGLANGGLITGPGTGTSDSIETEMPEGTYIMPADSTQQLGLGASRATVPVRVSNGETEVPPEQVMAVGAAALGALKDATHTPTGNQPDIEDVEDKLAPSFADGGLVDDQRRRDLLSKIPTGGITAPPAQPGSVLTDTDLGRNITNTLSAVAPVGAGGATRALSYLGRAGGAAAASPTAAAIAPLVPPVAGGAALVAAASPTAPTPAAATLPTPAATPTVDVTGRQPVGSAVPATSATAAPALGVIRRDGNSYSGTDVGANATIENARNPGAGVTVVPGGNFASSSPSGDAALAAARSAAADRGDFGAVRDSYSAQGQSFGGQAPGAATMTQEQLERLAYSAPGTRGRLFAQQQLRDSTQDATTRRGQTQTNEIAQARLGIDRSTAQAAQAERAALITARNAFLNAKTPEEKATAETTLRAMQGKYEKEYPELFTTTPLPGGVDEMGNRQPGGAIVTDKRTGATRIITGAEATGKAAAPAVGTVKNGFKFKGGDPADQKNWAKV